MLQLCCSVVSIPVMDKIYQLPGNTLTAESAVDLGFFGPPFRVFNVLCMSTVCVPGYFLIARVVGTIAPSGCHSSPVCQVAGVASLGRSLGQRCVLVATVLWLLRLARECSATY